MSDEVQVIEAEAAATRQRIATTIDDLQARLSPKALVDGALDSISAAGSQAVASVRVAAGGHPLVLGATGLIVALGVFAGRRVSRAKIEYGDSYAAYADYDDGYAANLADDDRAPGAARAQLAALQTQAHATVDGNPLAVLAVGVAAGAVIGAIVPVSAAEHAMFDEMRARLAAAGDAALAAARNEFDVSKLSLAGGTSGIGDRLAVSLIAVLTQAGAALVRPARPRSDA